MDRKITHIIEKDCLIRDFLRSRYSGRRIHFLRDGGRMFLNGREVTVRDTATAGDRLELIFSEQGEFNYPPEDLGLKAVYSDEDILVVYKPAGVPSMPAAPHFNGNLFNGLSFLYPNTVFRVVTRLDKDTSGLVLVAKNALSHSILHEEIRSVEKVYTAVCEGAVPAPLIIDAPIANGETAKRVINEGGKPSKTHVIASKWLGADGNISIVTLRLETGRTHQIRVHMAHAGYPLVGDALYGSKTGGGQLLACTSISLNHPVSREKLTFSIDGEGEMIARIKNFTNLSQKKL